MSIHKYKKKHKKGYVKKFLSEDINKFKDRSFKKFLFFSLLNSKLGNFHNSLDKNFISKMRKFKSYRRKIKNIKFQARLNKHKAHNIKNLKNNYNLYNNLRIINLKVSEMKTALEENSSQGRKLTILNNIRSARREYKSTLNKRFIQDLATVK